ncbi:MAG: hypothetical protein M3Y80_05265 [Verrucomicrobiota bacterium]|nr:hypothetical protein [Verrucomicrobiota bacterium]
MASTSSAGSDLLPALALPRRAYLYLAGFALHFCLIAIVSLDGTFNLIAAHATFLPRWTESLGADAAAVLGPLVGRTLPRTNPARQLTRAYLHATGIEVGYSYFAPNIPDSYKLVFEVQSADGSVEEELAAAENPESAVRVATLLDEVARTKSDALRELMMKLMAFSVWQQHPDAVSIRAIIGRLQQPTVAEYQAGTRASYEFLYAYDFSMSGGED